MKEHHCIQGTGDSRSFHCKRCGKQVAYILIPNGWDKRKEEDYTPLESHVKVVFGIHPNSIKKYDGKNGPVLIQEHLVFCENCNALEMLQKFIEELGKENTGQIWLGRNGVCSNKKEMCLIDDLGHFITMIYYSRPHSNGVLYGFQTEQELFEKMWKTMKDF